MRRALNEYRIGGIKTSIPFHQEMMDSTEFIWGTFDTSFLSRRRLMSTERTSDEHAKIAAVAATLIAHEAGRRAVHIGDTQASNQQRSLWKEASRVRSAGGRW